MQLLYPAMDLAKERLVKSRSANKYAIPRNLLEGSEEVTVWALRPVRCGELTVLSAQRFASKSEGRYKWN